MDWRKIVYIIMIFIGLAALILLVLHTAFGLFPDPIETTCQCAELAAVYI